MGAKLVPRSSPQAAGPSCAVWDLVLASQCIFLLTTDVVPCCAYVPSQPLRARSHEQGEEKTPPPHPAGLRAGDFHIPLPTLAS